MHGRTAVFVAGLTYGTNLFAHNALLAALAATHVDPALAAPLLGGGDLVLCCSSIDAH